VADLMDDNIAAGSNGTDHDHQQDDLTAKVKEWTGRSQGHSSVWWRFLAERNFDEVDASFTDYDTLQTFWQGVELGDILPDTGLAPCITISSLVDHDDSGSESEASMLPNHIPANVGPEQEQEKTAPLTKLNSAAVPWVSAFENDSFGAASACGIWYQHSASNYSIAGQQLQQQQQQRPYNPKIVMEWWPGDWYCERCHSLNYSRTRTCTICYATRGPKTKRLGMRPGDWICTGCGDLVFATTPACRMCWTSRPSEAFQ